MALSQPALFNLFAMLKFTADDLDGLRGLGVTDSDSLRDLLIGNDHGGIKGGVSLRAEKLSSWVVGALDLRPPDGTIQTNQMMVRAATDLRPGRDDAEIRTFLRYHAELVETAVSVDGDFSDTQVVWLRHTTSLLRQVTDPTSQTLDPCMAMAFTSLLLDGKTRNILVRQGALDYASLVRVIQRMETSADRKGIPEISYQVVAHFVQYLGSLGVSNPLPRFSWPLWEAYQEYRALGNLRTVYPINVYEYKCFWTAKSRVVGVPYDVGAMAAHGIAFPRNGN